MLQFDTTLFWDVAQAIRFAPNCEQFIPFCSPKSSIRCWMLVWSPSCSRAHWQNCPHSYDGNFLTTKSIDLCRMEDKYYFDKHPPLFLLIVRYLSSCSLHPSNFFSPMSLPFDRFLWLGECGKSLALHSNKSTFTVLALHLQIFCHSLRSLRGVYLPQIFHSGWPLGCRRPQGWSSTKSIVGIKGESIIPVLFSLPILFSYFPFLIVLRWMLFMFYFLATMSLLSALFRLIECWVRVNIGEQSVLLFWLGAIHFKCNYSFLLLLIYGTKSMKSVLSKHPPII